MKWEDTDIPEVVTKFIDYVASGQPDSEREESIRYSLAGYALRAMRQGSLGVGYGNPPVEHQFQPGNPGGPGRPKGSSLERALRRQLEAKDNRTLNRIVRQLVKNALKGDQRALNAIIKCAG